MSRQVDHVIEIAGVACMVVGLALLLWVFTEPEVLRGDEWGSANRCLCWWGIGLFWTGLASLSIIPEFRSGLRLGRRQFRENVDELSGHGTQVLLAFFALALLLFMLFLMH